MTLEELRQLADELQQRINLHGPASPEEQLKPFVSGILELAGETYGLEVITQAEAQLPEHNVRPDIAVHVDGLICGHVELKRSGTGAGPSAFTRNRDKKQWEKLKELPNLIYTDGCEWGLYRTGKRPALQPIVRFHDDPSMMGGNAIVEGDVEDLGRLLQDFLRWEPVVPHDLDGLAAYLAPLTRFLRAEVERALRNPDSPVRLLFKEWKRFLMPNATVEHFADNYAQTVVYSMLLARLDGAEDLDENEIIESLQDDHELVARAMQTFVLARDELSVGFDLLTRSLRAFHHGDLLQEMPDLWIYFYEHFIRAYDPKTRSNFGVYYTPREIVDFQVRMADFLIDDRFGKELGFADDGVVFLDPALGTGAYPVSAIRHGLNRVHDLYGAGDVPARANLMAENMYGFEVLMGPYAVAHLRLNRVLNEYGANLGDGGRLKIYLADTLESPNREPPDIFNPIQQTLSDEHESARMVKTEGEITVCLGNPPYDRQSTSGASRKGGWVRDGDGGPQADPKIFKDFTEPVRNAGNGRYLTTIYNDYVYFWRWALWRLFEQQDSGGIITFITPSSYLIGPGFAGMRETMRRRFDELWIVDLEGDGIGTRRTENVFGIKIPVCIAIGIRCPKPSPETPAIVRYVRVRGTKAEKLGCIKLYKTLDEIPWEECPDGWQDPFLPEGEGEFFEWPRLPQLLPWSHSGVMLGRTWPIGETEEVLETRWNALVAAEDEDERKKLFKETRDRKVDGNYNSFDGEELDPLNELVEGDRPERGIVRYSFRSFDRQHILLDNRLGDGFRPPLLGLRGDKMLCFTTMVRNALGHGAALVAATELPDLHCFCQRGDDGIFPLYRDADGTDPNITDGLLERIGETHGAMPTAEDFAAYVYAMLGGQSYTRLFWTELERPGPRVPITKDRRKFDKAAGLGSDLIRLHTYGKGFPRTGQDRTGQDRTGQDRTGQDRTGQDVHTGRGAECQGGFRQSGTLSEEILLRQEEEGNHGGGWKVWPDQTRSMGIRGFATQGRSILAQLSDEEAEGPQVLAA